MNQQFKRILIVRTDRIGDVILTLPLAEVLRKNFPEAHIAMMIRRYTSELVEDNRNVNQILYYDNDNHPLPFFQLVSILRDQHFDVVIHTYPRFRLALMTWISGIPARVGTGYRWYSFLFNKRLFEHRKDATRHELEYNLNLLTTLDCSFDASAIAPSLDVQPESLEKVKILLTRKGVHDSEKLVILHAGSGGSARNWSSENFGLLGKQLAKLPNIKIVLTGTNHERTTVEKIQSMIGGDAITFVDELNLKEFSALIKLSSLLIANSTGPIHIAAAVGTDVIGLYPHVLPMTAERWGPVTKKKVIFSPKNQQANCSMCVEQHSHVCECMETISADDVCSAAKNILANDTKSVETLSALHQ